MDTFKTKQVEAYRVDSNTTAFVLINAPRKSLALNKVLSTYPKSTTFHLDEPRFLVKDKDLFVVCKLLNIDILRLKEVLKCQ